MSSRRIQRINDLLREVIAEVVARDLKDPRLADVMISITEVQASPDMRQARVLVSVLGEEAQQQAAVAALTHSSGYIWRQIRPHLKLRSIPQLEFRLDNRIAEEREIQDLIDALAPVVSDDVADGAATAEAAKEGDRE